MFVVRGLGRGTLGAFVAMAVSLHPLIGMILYVLFIGSCVAVLAVGVVARLRPATFQT